MPSAAEAGCSASARKARASAAEARSLSERNGGVSSCLLRRKRGRSERKLSVSFCGRSTLCGGSGLLRERSERKESVSFCGRSTLCGGSGLPSERSERKESASFCGRSTLCSRSGLLSERSERKESVSFCGARSAAEAGCFARGLSGGDSPNPPYGLRGCTVLARSHMRSVAHALGRTCARSHMRSRAHALARLYTGAPN
jgi:hypothetical protein